MSNLIEDTFAITDSRSLNYGATIIDENPECGYDSETMMRIKNHSTMLPKEALNFYPEVIDLQKELGDDNIWLATTWINGFAPISGGLPTPFAMNKNKMHRRIASRFHKRGIATSEQLIAVRQESIMNTLFSHFRWYNGDNIISPSNIDDDDLKNIVLKSGSVSANWRATQPSIRFMIRQKAFLDEDGEAVPDYLYLIGGSHSVVNPNKAIESIKHMAAGEMKSSRTTYWERQNPSEFQRDIVVSRICFGIIMIRNYLVYAKNYIKVSEVVDIDHSRGEGKRFVNRPIDDVIAEYEPAFIYCRNLSNIFNI